MEGHGEKNLALHSSFASILFPLLPLNLNPPINKSPNFHVPLESHHHHCLPPKDHPRGMDLGGWVGEGLGGM